MARTSKQSIQAGVSSLWTLLNSNSISMPLYQRDYVQGRDNAKDNTVSLIRREFVTDLIGAVTDDRKIELHFIFGGRDKNRDAGYDFVPVDGQQRLTALFLLHWYVFSMSGATEKERQLMKRFQYKSRETSRRFCERLIDLLEDGPTTKINGCKDIEDCSWFTGNIACDPTVRSMLVVLLEIENQFKNKGVEDWSRLHDRLTAEDCEDCPITFLRLDMQNELGGGNEIRDLYIKMNDRGKQLTDFENFKAYLHKTLPEVSGEFDLLGEYLRSQGKTDSEAERVRLLGRINNEYTNFFFRFINGGEIQDNSCGDSTTAKGGASFDTAMMNYFNEMIRMSFFRQVHLKGVSAKKYNNHGSEIFSMSGKAFYRFITSSASAYRDQYDGSVSEEEARAAILAGFTDALYLLDILIDPANEVCLPDEPKPNTCSPLQLIRETAGEKTNSLLAASRGMLAFIKKFGLRGASDDLFAAWYGLVWRCIRFTEFEHLSDAVSIGRSFEAIIDLMTEGSPASLWRAILDLPTDDTSTLFEHHFMEERVKAGLYLSSDSAVWIPLIDEAVSWRQDEIYYLFQLSEVVDDSQNVFCSNHAEFREYLDLFKEIFPIGTGPKNAEIYVVGGDASGNKHLRRSFENALLLSSTPTPDLPYCHLLKKGNGSLMHFLYGDYYELIKTLAYDHVDLKEQRKIFLGFIRTLKSRCESTLQDKLDAILNTYPTLDDGDWRKCFIEEDLYFLKFLSYSDTYDAAIHKTPDEYYLLYQNGKQKHTKSTEVHTAALYSRLIGMGKDAVLQTDTRDIHWDRDASDIPFRYLTCDEVNVYYCNGGFHIQGDGTDTSYDLDGIVAVLTASEEE